MVSDKPRKVKIAIIAIGAFLAGSLIGAGSFSLTLRQPVPTAVPRAEVCPWPPSLDAVEAAPGNHRVLLENDRVRVLDVVVPPDTREPVHAHCLPSAMVILEGGKARDYDGQGQLLDEGTVIPEGTQAPFAFWLDRTPPHSVHNIDSTPIHLIRVEVKPALSPQPKKASPDSR
jgi:mannose-6-phosphate isomerase-like protein (cupin superfamily)